ncbi:MAG: acyl carrier protein [Gammaproteobacteria bacterium]|nr:acyl carrier protein [Gammaproteobacteria bacterium]MBI5618897.1 acyl carrier protein [Gammaproteobacteria bacterium]
MIEAQLKAILGDVLGLKDRGAALTPDSGLMGTLPEFDSMAVVSILTAIEERFGVTVSDDEVDAEIFQTVGSLLAFVTDKVA